MYFHIAFCIATDLYETPREVNINTRFRIPTGTSETSLRLCGFADSAVSSSLDSLTMVLLLCSEVTDMESSESDESPERRADLYADAMTTGMENCGGMKQRK